jgi:hypothetical protein
MTYITRFVWGSGMRRYHVIKFKKNVVDTLNAQSIYCVAAMTYVTRFVWGECVAVMVSCMLKTRIAVQNGVLPTVNAQPSLVYVLWTGYLLVRRLELEGSELIQNTVSCIYSTFNHRHIVLIVCIPFQTCQTSYVNYNRRIYFAGFPVN